MSPDVEHLLVAWWQAATILKVQPWHTYVGEARKTRFNECVYEEQEARDALFAQIEKEHAAQKETRSYAPLPRYLTPTDGPRSA